MARAGDRALFSAEEIVANRALLHQVEGALVVLGFRPSGYFTPLKHDDVNDELKQLAPNLDAMGRFLERKRRESGDRQTYDRLLRDVRTLGLVSSELNPIVFAARQTR